MEHGRVVAALLEQPPVGPDTEDRRLEISAQHRLAIGLGRQVAARVVAQGPRPGMFSDRQAIQDEALDG